MPKIIDSRTSATGEPIFSAYLHSKARKLGIPVSGTFELTPRCNFDCKMCYIHSSDCNSFADREISAEKWIELGRRVKDNGVLFLLLTGGEPLLRNDFPYIYKSLNEMGFILSVNTNGSLITDEIFELFKAYPPHRISISLYGASNETYLSLCGNEKFDTVLSNIKRLKEAGIQVKVNCSLTPYNCNDADKIYSITNELGANIKFATYMYPPLRNSAENTGKNTGRFTPYEGAYHKVKCDLMKNGKDKFIERADLLKKGILLSENECIEPSEEGEALRCRAGVTTFWVDWRGYMSPCGMIPDEEFNVFEKDFSECWKATREKAGKIRMPAECTGCKYKSICGVCAAACLCETGEYGKKPEYICQFSKNVAEIMEKEAERLRSEKNGD